MRSRAFPRPTRAVHDAYIYFRPSAKLLANGNQARRRSPLVYPLTSNIRLRAVTRIPPFSNSLPGLLVYYRTILLNVGLHIISTISYLMLWKQTGSSIGKVICMISNKKPRMLHRVLSSLYFSLSNSKRENSREGQRTQLSLPQQEEQDDRTGNVFPEAV